MHSGRQSGTPVLVRGGVRRAATQHWDEQASRVLTGTGFQRLLGGPGTGKTTLLAETAARRILAGDDAEQVLVLTASRRAADALRSQITRLLTNADENPAGTPRTVREPLVRTVHSYAFGVLRAQASVEGTPPPRLLSGPEQDTVVRELLDGDLAVGAEYWPERLRPALAVAGFAEELRDLLLRAAERGLGPEDLVRVGKRAKRDEWIAAGTFWRQYEQVTMLQAAGGSALAAPSAIALDAAELVTSALLALTGDADLLSRERRRVRYLFVDDAQHLDPLQYRLISMIGAGAAQFVLAGDPDQAVFSFRGADPTVLTGADPDGTRTVVLRSGHRMAAEVHAALTAITAAMPGAAASRESAPAGPGGEVMVRQFPTQGAEAGWIANQLRRAHLVAGVAWSDMAIVVRSARQTFPVLQRALRAAGVPIATRQDELPLARNPAVRPLLTALKAAAADAVIDADIAEQLVSSPLGGADPLAMRRLRRGLRRLELAEGGRRSSDELLVEALRTQNPLPALADSEGAPLRRVGTVLAAGRAALAKGLGVEQVLWELWRASGLQQRWLRLAERGGTLGRQADADLDAVVALFHAAGSYVDRLPEAGVAGFADYLLAQRIAGDSLAPTALTSPGVELLTAHGAAGREWSVVVVACVQEGSWPDVRLRGSLLGVERLVDLLAGVDTSRVSAIAPVLAEERRLFALAASRARSTLIVTATQGEDEQPSRFLDDLERTVSANTEDAAPVHQPATERVLVLSRLVGELRAAVCDQASDLARRARAARQLAKLAKAGVPGADPRTWYGLAEVSTTAPLRQHDELISVSPSTVELLTRCPLRWLIERHGGADGAPLAAVSGTLVHALAQAAAGGATDAQLRAALADAWQQVDAGAPWYARREHDRLAAMITTFRAWFHGSRSQLSEVAVETDIEALLPGEPGVSLRGRVDRLERDSAGRLVVVDLKTAKTPVSKADAQQNPQLAAYQLALSVGSGAEPGGGRLVYVGKPHRSSGATERVQDPLDADGIREWHEMVRAAATATVGPEFLAREGADCDRCPARSCCPLQQEGRQVTT